MPHQPSLLLRQTLASMKHPAFKEEKEIRLIAFPTGDFSPLPSLRTGANHLVPYVAVEFPHAAIRSIRVGPSGQSERNVEALRKFFRYQSRGAYSHLKIVTSSIPFVGNEI